ncbi:MAG: heme lyase CcmF/NrfE family subunit [Alphaproteobacteria bacterium]|nr:heme lyase CcmF/NrfE family subunit [Alphaproteobacteria bacterium]
MIAELGQFLLILAFLVALLQSGLIFLGLRTGDTAVFGFARAGAIAQFVLVGAAFACLTWLFAVSDFSVLVVADNSHSEKPFIYKLTGVWGNHEGSMLLWCLMLTGYTGVLAWTANGIAPRLITLTFAVQSMITAAFTAFLLFTSNPFARLWPAPADGNDLNPLLQDPGLASHPPMLYAGYVGFSITFSFAVAALIEGRADARWARIVRPWALAAWTFLTIGILLGASWAYFELGWGGWWAWDPVENASLMPWLAGTAFIHSLRVMEKRDTLKAWTILLALMAFPLSLVGTFLVRSVIITSVHAFAVYPERGVFILAILAVVVGGALALYGWRANCLKPTGVFSEISRESSLVVNNLVLAAACALVFFGTFYPLFVTTVSDETLTIGAPFYNATFNPLVGTLLILVPISGMLAWKRAKPGPLLRQLAPAAIAMLAAGIIAFALADHDRLAGAMGTALAVWIAVGLLIDLKSRLKLFDIPLAASLARARNLPLGIWGMIVAHFGVGILVLAITGVSAWKTESRSFMQPGDSLTMGQYEIVLEGVSRVDRDNFIAEEGLFHVYYGERDLGSLAAERRFYPVRGMSTTESAVQGSALRDVYITIGEPVATRGWPVHVYIYPLAFWLWVGGAIISLGGALSIADRGRRSLLSRKPAAEQVQVAE